MSKGKRFEELVGWIQKSVHKNAIVEVDAKLRDVDTGRSRQVDVAITVRDGPTHLLAIVEVRDRNRPVGVRYIEELSEKRRSVGADAVFVVSRSGFCSTAVTKAQQLGIRTLTLDEALAEDWSGWLQCRSIEVVETRYDRTTVYFADYDTVQTLTLSADSLAAAKDRNAKILCSEDGSSLVSVHCFVHQVVSAFGDRPFAGLAVNGRWQERDLLFDKPFEPPLWVRCEDGRMHRIGKVYIKASFRLECRSYPLRLMRYRREGSRESIAEIAVADVTIGGEKRRLELLAGRAGEQIPPGEALKLRLSPLPPNGGGAPGE